MDVLSVLSKILASHEITEFGVCDYRKISHFHPCRNAHRIPADTKSVLIMAIPYATEEVENSNLCQYARVPDYHKVVAALLEEIICELKQYFCNEFIGFTDISALPEKECAVQAGIGFYGKNTLVINPKYGSYFVLGEIVTDLLLPFSMPETRQCAGCNACINHCPAQALTENGMDATCCLSAITQKKGELTASEQTVLRKNKLAWGCDVCQQVCPHNQDVPHTPIKAFSEQVEPLLTIENLDELKKSRAFGWRGKQVLLRNLQIINSQDRFIS